MNCPECGGTSKVVDSRAKDGESIRRRRACLKCGHRFSTVEVYARRSSPAQSQQANPMEMLQRLAALHESMQVCIKRLFDAAEIKT